MVYKVTASVTIARLDCQTTGGSELRNLRWKGSGALALACPLACTVCEAVSINGTQNETVLAETDSLRLRHIASDASRCPQMQVGVCGCAADRFPGSSY